MSVQTTASPERIAELVAEQVQGLATEPVQFVIMQFGVRMYPNTDLPDWADQGPGVRELVGSGPYPAIDSATAMNALANGPDAASYHVRRAEPVRRRRIVFANGAEILTDWETIQPGQAATATEI